MRRSFGQDPWDDEEGVDSTEAEAEPEQPAVDWLAGRSGTRLRAAEKSGPVCKTFKDVYERFRGYAWHTILASVRDPDRAEDVHQRVFTTVARKIRENGGIFEDVVFMVHEIIQGEIRNHERIQARRRTDGEADGDVTPSSCPDPEQRLLGIQDDLALKVDLHEILGKLTPDQRTVLTLRHIDELTIKEIAVITGKKPGTVAVELHRARKKLHELCGRSTAMLKRLRRK